MNIVTCVYFNENNWDKFGVNWLRKSKSNSKNTLIIGKNLSVEAENKCIELGFEFSKLESNFNDDRDIIVAMSKIVTKDKKYLLLSQGFEFDLNYEIYDKKDLICLSSLIELMNLVLPIQSLANRAKVVNLLSNKKSLASSDFILGSYDFWKKIDNFQEYLSQVNYFGSVVNLELLLNLYIAIVNSSNIEVINYV